jgi:hypothetical protein
VCAEYVENHGPKVSTRCVAIALRVLYIQLEEGTPGILEAQLAQLAEGPSVPGICGHPYRTYLGRRDLGEKLEEITRQLWIRANRIHVHFVNHQGYPPETIAPEIDENRVPYQDKALLEDKERTTVLVALKLAECRENTFLRKVPSRGIVAVSGADEREK